MTVQQVNKYISSYKNSQYKWVRELTESFEEYFDKKFRESLSHKYLANMQEADLKLLFLIGLDILHNIISSDSSYLGNLESSTPFGFIEEIARYHERPLDKEKAKKLFEQVTMPWEIFKMNIERHRVEYLLLKSSEQQNDKELQKLEIRNQSLNSALRNLKGEYENKDRTIETQNRFILKLRRGIDDKAGMEKLKFLIDKCFKGKASQVEQQEAYIILDRIANNCRKDNTYKTLIYSRLGNKLGIHHTTAKKWCLLLGVKKYC